MQKLIIFISLFFIFCTGFIALDIILEKPSSPILPNISQTIKEPVELTDDEKTLAKASEQFYNQYLLRTRFNGAMLIAKAGKIVFERYNGFTEINKGMPIDSSIAFHLASVSKTFTAMGILKLGQDNKLNIDDPVSKYIKNFPYAEITIRNLLSHRSGLPNYVHFMESMGWNTREILTNQSLLDFIIKHARIISRGRPNSYFDYSNTNYALLAIIIENVTKLNYATFLEDSFFKPIGMSHTFVYNPSMQETVLPSFKFNNQKERFNFLDAVYGDKNIYSTVRDMMKWDLAISDGSLFTKTTLDQAFQGYSHERKGIKNYGLGWRLYEMPSGKKIIYHNGWWHGNNTVFSRLPDDSTTIIVLGNKFNRSIYQAKKIIGIYDGYGFQFNEDE